MSDSHLSPDELQGILKQQCLDESGLYEWVKKRFRLIPTNAILEIYDLNDEAPIIRTGLVGAKYAKEWSIASNIAGFGFDIVWYSGKLWSFLCDDEVSCKNWVNRLNYTFSLISSNANSSYKELNSTYASKSSLHSHRHAMNENPMKHAEMPISQTPPVPEYINALERQDLDKETSQDSDCSGIHDNTLQAEVICKNSQLNEQNLHHNVKREILSVEYHTPVASSTQKQGDAKGHRSEVNLSSTLNHCDLKGIQASWEEEKTRIVDMHNREISRLIESEVRAKERMQAAEHEESQLRHKLSHLTSQIEKLTLDYSRMCIEQKSELESARQSYDLQLVEEKSRMNDEFAIQLSKLKQEHSIEQNDFLCREKIMFEKEISKLRNHYENRERETSLDLKNLERLHSERVHELGQRVEEWRTKAEKGELHETDWDLRLQHIVKDHERQLELHKENSQHLKEELAKAHTELQESRTSEEIYRSQMTELLEQNRILRAEYVESRHQADTGMSQAHQLRKVIRDADLSESSRVVSLQIADDEIKMLEHEVDRLTTVNQSLTDELRRYESLVYGRVTDANAKRYGSNNQMNPNVMASKFHSLNKNSMSSAHVVRGKSKSTSTSSKIAKVTPVSKNSTTRFSKSAHSHQQQYKYRDGCTRSPLRCQGSSLVLLDADDYEILDLHESQPSEPRKEYYADGDFSFGSLATRGNHSWRA